MDASHELAARSYSTPTLLAIREDLGGRNLSNLRNHETRWLADRCKAVRAELRQRGVKRGSKP